jgi:hypothetical protein
MIAFMNVVYNITLRNAGTSATESRVWHCVAFTDSLLSVPVLLSEHTLQTNTSSLDSFFLFFIKPFEKLIQSQLFFRGLCDLQKTPKNEI